jgi:hypothetical protein
VPWICPDCRRQFGRTNQSHGCAPSGTVEDYFADRPAVQRKIFDALARHLTKREDVTIDPVSVCIMFKRSRSFAEVRSKRSALVLTFLLSREVDDPRIAKTMKLSAHRWAHWVELEKVGDVDRDVREWLNEAHACSPV